jgi:hypothetical protein
LPTLEFQYPNVNFNDRNSVLATAKALEDTGVAAYNGAGKYITNADYLVIAGKLFLWKQDTLQRSETLSIPELQLSPEMM